MKDKSFAYYKKSHIIENFIESKIPYLYRQGLEKPDQRSLLLNSLKSYCEILEDVNEFMNDNLVIKKGLVLYAMKQVLEDPKDHLLTFDDILKLIVNEVRDKKLSHHDISHTIENFIKDKIPYLYAQGLEKLDQRSLLMEALRSYLNIIIQKPVDE